MAQQENKLLLSKKSKREVSPFLGHEMLYDYLCGNLDKERRAAVEDYVKFSRDAQLDLSKIQEGQKYAARLSQTVVSQPIITQINTPSSYLHVLMQKTNFSQWPQGLKWGLEALVVVLVIVSVLTLTPWEKFLRLKISTGPKEVILAEVARNEAPKQVETQPEFVDEVATLPRAPQSPQVSVSPPVKVAENPDVKSPTPSGGGYLYRGDIAVTNLEAVRAKITEKIVDLGGRKAGSVDLGWQKTSTLSYYHFTMPSAKYEELTTFLSKYGRLKLVKEKHPRVMPDGILRLIINVDEAKK